MTNIRLCDMFHYNDRSPATQMYNKDTKEMRNKTSQKTLNRKA